jgi:hypothetical protein
VSQSPKNHAYAFSHTPLSTNFNQNGIRFFRRVTGDSKTVKNTLIRVTNFVKNVDNIVVSGLKIQVQMAKRVVFVPHFQQTIVNLLFFVSKFAATVAIRILAELNATFLDGSLAMPHAGVCIGAHANLSRGRRLHPLTAVEAASN